MGLGPTSKLGPYLLRRTAMSNRFGIRRRANMGPSPNDVVHIDAALSIRKSVEESRHINWATALPSANTGTLGGLQILATATAAKTGDRAKRRTRSSLPHRAEATGILLLNRSRHRPA